MALNHEFYGVALTGAAPERSTFNAERSSGRRKPGCFGFMVGRTVPVSRSSKRGSAGTLQNVALAR